MRALRSWWAISSVCIALAGCAYTTAIPVSPNDRSTPGIRFYDRKPLLFVTDAGASISFIPNYNRAYALQFGAFLAKNDVMAEFAENGLNKLTSNMDSTALVDLLKTIAEKTLTPTGKVSGGTPPSFPLRAVFEFEFNDYGDLVRLRRIDHGNLPRVSRVPIATGGTEGGRLKDDPDAPPIDGKH